MNTKTSVVNICRLVGKSKTAYYKKGKTMHKRAILEKAVLEEVNLIRTGGDHPEEALPKTGGRKLHEAIKAGLAGRDLKVGRDVLFDILRTFGLLIKQRKRRVPQTTDGKGNQKHKDLRNDFVPTARGQMISTDITYIRLKGGKFCYLTLVTDEFNHEILGFAITIDMKAESISMALVMAIEALGGTDKVRKLKLIHHSDKGSQFTSSHFEQIFADNNIRVSMTENGNGWENPVAERINGILKGELLKPCYENFEEASKDIANAVWRYNYKRLHSSCDMMTPIAARAVEGPQKRRWKNYKKKPKPSE